MPISSDTLLILIAVLGGFAVVYGLLRKHFQTQPQEDMEDMVARVFGMSADKVAEQSRHILAGERSAIKVDLDNKQQMIEKMVTDLQRDLTKHQTEIRGLEQDREKKFSEMSSALNQHRELTQELKISTEQLASVLSNNQQRGAWGERIIEDLLENHGLIEGIHYGRQRKLGSTSMIPDITLLLPNERVVAVDVKFPYSEVQKLAAATTSTSQKIHLKQFATDIRVKINQVANYIDPEQNTLDYAIMFVPNEAVFSFINQKFPEIVDEAMAKRVIMVSPFTFMIVARTVMESYRNFMISDSLREIVGYVDEFVDEWHKFHQKFEKYGRTLQTLQSDYTDITTTRVRQMERKLEKIDTYRQGNGLELVDDTIVDKAALE